MKNYNEMATDVFRRIDEYETTQKRKKKAIARTVTSMCCVCLVALMGVGVWQSGLLEQTPPAVADNSGISLEQPDNNQQNNPVVSTPDEEADNPPANNDNISNPNGITTQSPDNSLDKELFAINRINGIGLASPKKFPDNHYKEIWDNTTMSEYLGVDLQKIGVALDNGLKTEIVESYSVVYDEDGTMIYDISNVRFIGDNNQQITVFASKLSMPYDCLYNLESENTTSIRLRDSGEIISVLVAAQNKNETTGEYELCVADFEYNGVNYRIKAENAPMINIDRLIREIAE